MKFSTHGRVSGGRLWVPVERRVEKSNLKLSVGMFMISFFLVFVFFVQPQWGSYFLVWADGFVRIFKFISGPLE